MGLSVARSLLKQGHSVRIFEQSNLPNVHGSSFDDHRLIRYPYGTQQGYMQMVTEAYNAWERLWIDIGKEHYTNTGTLVISSSLDGWASDSLKALENSSINFTTLSSGQLKEIYPLLNCDGIVISMYLETGGVLFASKILTSLKEFAQKGRAQIHEGTLVSSIDSYTGTIRTRGNSVFSSDLIIVTAGAWLPDLLPEYTRTVTPSRQTTQYFQLNNSEREYWHQMPMILDIGPDSGFYLVPPVSGLGLKVGDHRFSLKGHPNHRNTLYADRDALQIACQRIPLLHDYPIERIHVCYYTVAEREQFIGFRTNKTWVLTGFSGHGFKFGPLIGEQFAAVISKQIHEHAFTRWLAGDLADVNGT